MCMKSRTPPPRAPISTHTYLCRLNTTHIPPMGTQNGRAPRWGVRGFPHMCMKSRTPPSVPLLEPLLEPPQVPTHGAREAPIPPTAPTLTLGSGPREAPIPPTHTSHPYPPPPREGGSPPPGSGPRDGTAPTPTPLPSRARRWLGWTPPRALGYACPTPRGVGALLPRGWVRLPPGGGSRNPRALSGGRIPSTSRALGYACPTLGSARGAARGLWVGMDRRHRGGGGGSRACRRIGNGQHEKIIIDLDTEGLKWPTGENKH